MMKSAKSVTFGNIEVIEIESILFTREIYNEKRYMDRIVNMVSNICEHEDVYHVDIYIDRKNKEDFIKDLSNIMELTFGASKNSNIIIGDKTKFCFKDGYSNPSFDQNFLIEVDWEK